MEQLVLAVKGEIVMSPELDKVSLHHDSTILQSPLKKHELSKRCTTTFEITPVSCVTNPPATGVQSILGESSPGRVAAARVREP